MTTPTNLVSAAIATVLEITESLEVNGPDALLSTRLIAARRELNRALRAEAKCACRTPATVARVHAEAMARS